MSQSKIKSKGRAILLMSARYPALATSPGFGFCSFSRASDICVRKSAMFWQALIALHHKLNILANIEASPEALL